MLFLIGCGDGYYGKDCSQQCGNNVYGPACGKTCNCTTDQRCDHVIGCIAGILGFLGVERSSISLCRRSEQAQ